MAMFSNSGQQVAGPPDHGEARTDVTRLYTPITKWQTRILRLHAGTKDTPLRADLLVAGLIHDEGIVLDWTTNESVSYEAISYSWGSDKATKLITVNGQDCYINPSLASALRRFRYRTTTRYLWADQLCVHQTDDAEKSVQVRNMFTIFRKAERVIAWLGEEREGTGGALESYLQSDAMRTSEQKGEGGAEIIVVEDEEHYDTLAAVCLTPWPRRVWIQQEDFAARQLTVHYGRCSFTLEQYKDLVKTMRDSQIKSKQTELERQWSSLKDLTMSDEHMIVLNRAKVVSTTWVTSMKSPFTVEEADLIGHDESDSAYISTLLETVLSRSRNLEASNSRDYIYALLNLTHHPIADNELLANAIAIDYSRSVERIYEDVTRSILNRDQSLRILKYGSRHKASRVGLELPSWVVDWPSLAREAKFWIPEGGLSKLALQPYNEEGTLELHGFRLGQVSLITRERKTPDEEARSVTFLSLRSHIDFPGVLTLKNDLGRIVYTSQSGRAYIIPRESSTSLGFSGDGHDEHDEIELQMDIIGRTVWADETGPWTALDYHL
ncbi:hypothetical protein LTR56_023685 [Elasticomyces elasticus]|nr:hypothetical protein LTR56_023685 [Elasticomyces elasticus]KAK3624948.1 hypothetical protein LTR22_023771 [Elasticomyces elasticus]KAK4908924.1 hypothetical protein LTR49_022228 [Elasticomyces elasticus]KAK5745825.1 hypothetical protein LTS12_022977 [Elasticomyces elasticus]